VSNPPEGKKFTSENAAEMGAKGGRNKKGTKHLSTYIQEALTDENFELKLKDGTILKEMPIKAIIKTAVAKSVSGDTRAMEWLAKHGYGEKINLEVTDTRKDILSRYGLISEGGDGETPNNPS
jgi:hypothetical protein